MFTKRPINTQFPRFINTQFHDNNFNEISWSGFNDPAGLRSPKTPRPDRVNTFFIVVIGKIVSF